MICLENAAFLAMISEIGGRLQSIYNKDVKLEYLWQGDPTYWKGTAPNLFPIIGRLFESRYTLDGKSYDIRMHGFLSGLPMKVLSYQRDAVLLAAEDDAQTRAVYPYRFRVLLSYALDGGCIKICFTVENHSDTCIYFGIGGHPGFRVPLEKEGSFSDYYLSFGAPCRPNLVELSSNVLCTGRRMPYPLVNDEILPLRHKLFTHDAIVLADAARSVTLHTDTGAHGVRVDYPQMPYIAFWHTPGTDAPFLCIEPWSMLPGRENVVEELPHMADICHAEPNGTSATEWSITVF